MGKHGAMSRSGCRPPIRLRRRLDHRSDSTHGCLPPPGCSRRLSRSLSVSRESTAVWDAFGQCTSLLELEMARDGTTAHMMHSSFYVSKLHFTVGVILGRAKRVWRMCPLRGLVAPASSSYLSYIAMDGRIVVVCEVDHASTSAIVRETLCRGMKRLRLSCATLFAT
jgi:hypothetical protein